MELLDKLIELLDIYVIVISIFLMMFFYVVNVLFWSFVVFRVVVCFICCRDSCNLDLYLYCVFLEYISICLFGNFL